MWQSTYLYLLSTVYQLWGVNISTSERDGIYKKRTNSSLITAANVRPTQAITAAICQISNLSNAVLSVTFSFLMKNLHIHCGPARARARDLQLTRSMKINLSTVLRCSLPKLQLCRFEQASLPTGRKEHP